MIIRYHQYSFQIWKGIMAFVLWEDNAVILKWFLPLSIDVLGLLLLVAMKTPLCSRDVNIKPIYSVDVTNSPLLGNEVQYQMTFFYLGLKEVQDIFGFVENLHQPPNQSSVKLKSIATWSFMFSWALLTLNSYLLRAIPNKCQKKAGLHWLSITSLCDWSRKLSSGPIRCIIKPICDVITPFFSPPVMKFAEGSVLTVFVSFASRHNCPICAFGLGTAVTSWNRGFKPR